VLEYIDIDMDKTFWEKIIRDTNDLINGTRSYLALLVLWALFEPHYNKPQIKKELYEVADGFWDAPTNRALVKGIIRHYNQIKDLIVCDGRDGKIISGNSRDDIVKRIKQTRGKLAHGQLPVKSHPRTNKEKAVYRLILSSAKLLHKWLKTYYWTVGKNKK